MTLRYFRKNRYGVSRQGHFPPAVDGGDVLGESGFWALTFTAAFTIGGQTRNVVAASTTNIAITKFNPGGSFAFLSKICSTVASRNIAAWQDWTIGADGCFYGVAAAVGAAAPAVIRAFDADDVARIADLAMVSTDTTVHEFYVVKYDTLGNCVFLKRVLGANTATSVTDGAFAYPSIHVFGDEIRVSLAMGGFAGGLGNSTWIVCPGDPAPGNVTITKETQAVETLFLVLDKSNGQVQEFHRHRRTAVPSAQVFFFFEDYPGHHKKSADDGSLALALGSGTEGALTNYAFNQGEADQLDVDSTNDACIALLNPSLAPSDVARITDGAALATNYVRSLGVAIDPAASTIAAAVTQVGSPQVNYAVELADGTVIGGISEDIGGFPRPNTGIASFASDGLTLNWFKVIFTSSGDGRSVERLGIVGSQLWVFGGTSVAVNTRFGNGEAGQHTQARSGAQLSWLARFNLADGTYLGACFFDGGGYIRDCRYDANFYYISLAMNAAVTVNPDKASPVVIPFAGNVAGAIVKVARANDVYQAHHFHWENQPSLGVYYVNQPYGLG